VLWLSDPDREPQRRDEPGGVHAGARPITGGAARLVDALAATLLPGSVRTGSALRLPRDRGAWLELQLELQLEGQGGKSLRRVRRAVLALPPRLVKEHIAFDPPLPAVLADAMAATPTWMASQAKVVTSYAQPFWRAAGHSGNAFARHAQAMLGEVFDAGDEGTGAGALGGFVALNAAQRVNFKRGMAMLSESQLAQLCGVQAQRGGRQHLQDWAQDHWTCSAAVAERASQGSAGAVPDDAVEVPFGAESLTKELAALGAREVAEMSFARRGAAVRGNDGFALTGRNGRADLFVQRGAAALRAGRRAAGAQQRLEGTAARGAVVVVERHRDLHFERVRRHQVARGRCAMSGLAAQAACPPTRSHTSVKPKSANICAQAWLALP